MRLAGPAFCAHAAEAGQLQEYGGGTDHGYILIYERVSATEVQDLPPLTAAAEDASVEPRATERDL